MPVPGPRTQWRALPGYTNPDGEEPHRINRWHRPGPIIEVGRSPGTMSVSARGHVLGAGQIRRLWRQAINYTGTENFSWTSSAPGAGGHVLKPGGFHITRALRYMTRSVYAPAGTDNSRYHALHTAVQPRVRHKPVTIGAGGVQNRPTIRNRLTSFGSRVTPLNARAPAATK